MRRRSAQKKNKPRKPKLHERFQTLRQRKNFQDRLTSYARLQWLEARRRPIKSKDDAVLAHYTNAGHMFSQIGGRLKAEATQKEAEFKKNQRWEEDFRGICRFFFGLFTSTAGCYALAIILLSIVNICGVLESNFSIAYGAEIARLISDTTINFSNHIFCISLTFCLIISFSCLPILSRLPEINSRLWCAALVLYITSFCAMIVFYQYGDQYTGIITLSSVCFAISTIFFLIQFIPGKLIRSSLDRTFRKDKEIEENLFEEWKESLAKPFQTLTEKNDDELQIFRESWLGIFAELKDNTNIFENRFIDEFVGGIASISETNSLSLLSAWLSRDLGKPAVNDLFLSVILPVESGIKGDRYRLWAV